jgi:hypothetical protein
MHGLISTTIHYPFHISHRKQDNNIPSLPGIEHGGNVEDPLLNGARYVVLLLILFEPTQERIDTEQDTCRDKNRMLITVVQSRTKNI